MTNANKIDDGQFIHKTNENEVKKTTVKENKQHKKKMNKKYLKKLNMITINVDCRRRC